MPLKENYGSDSVEVSKEMLAWADIKDSHKTKNVLYATAIGIESIPVGKKEEECLKLNYDGVFGYLPISLIDEYEFKGLQNFLGKEFEFVVQSVDLDNHLFVGNRIEALKVLAQKFWKSARAGDTYDAFVRGVDPFNLYLIVDGVRTKLYRDEYSYSFVEDLRTEVEIGDIIPVKILKLVKPGQKFKKPNIKGEEVDAEAGEQGYLEVSSRVLKQDPWNNIVNYRERATYLGTITKIHMEHGLFIELEGTPGLILRTNFPPNSSGQRFKKGHKVNVKLLEINVKRRLIKGIVINPKQSVGEKNFRRRGMVR
jgi:small subunit ribosomal protein S1